MALITNQITARNFELIRDKIGVILALELAAQTYTADLKAIWGERKVPFTPVELSCVNISYGGTNFDNANTSYKRGTNIYYIDVYVSEPSTNSAQGDVLGALKAERIAGIIDYILSSPYYQTLGFAPGFIAHTIVESISMSGMTSQDAYENIGARLQFQVVAGEDTAQIAPTDVAGIDTEVNIEETDFGHLYTINNN